MGKRKFKQQILHPTTNIEYLNKEYEIVHYIKTNWEKFEPIRKEFCQFKDLEKLYRKIVLNRVSPAELVRFYENMELILVLNANLSKDETIQTYIADKIDGIEEIETNCKELRQKLDETLVLDKAQFISNTNNFDTNFFQQTVNVELDETQELNR